MAFMAMTVAFVFVIAVATGLFILLLGIIFDIRWKLKARKQESVSKVFKGFAIVLTVWGIIQGIGPIAVVGALSLQDKMKHRAEISDLPDDSIIYLHDANGIDDSFDFKGVHFVSDSELHPQVSHKNHKTQKVGAIVLDSGDHYIIDKIENGLDADIFQTGTIYDPYVPEAKLSEINDYYHNKAPLYCEVIKDFESSEDICIEDIDSDRIRKIRDSILTPGLKSYSDINSYDAYLFFYPFDDMECIDFSCKETDQGFVVEYLGDAKIIPEDDADYLRSLIK